MNYVYEHDYAVLVRLKVPEGAKGVGPDPRRAPTGSPAPTRSAFRKAGRWRSTLPVGTVEPDRRAQFDAWRRALPRPLVTPATFEISGDKLRVAVPLPRDVAVGEPYLFPAADGPVDYAGKQTFRRAGDQLIAELPRRSGEPDAVRRRPCLRRRQGAGISRRPRASAQRRAGRSARPARKRFSGRCSARSWAGCSST